MRVVAGEFRGRKLVSPPRGAEVRPTADRVREALFSILGDVSGLEVLDVFCGTGALGIEAVSRGASRATFVDSHTGLVERNLEALGLGERAEVVRADAIGYLRRPGEAFDLILCDPPYRLADRLEADLRTLLPGRLRRGGRLVVESSARASKEFDLRLERERRYGQSLLKIWRNDR